MSQASSKEDARMQLAERLKEEGNALFSKQKFGPASKKYTEAIAIDNSNPILKSLPSNSPATTSRNTFSRYLDAVADATRAVELNPTYAKAYARAATARDALGQPSLSKVAWQKALDALPSESPTEAEIKQKKQ
ncbi:hypothetical protein MPER_14979 [Moniliophthora perniciosa FA553]|nr:hypothetical protein MPER_14979 [Moniliophthora perniciosa FA553]